MKIKTVNRNINFDSRLESSSYKVQYNDPSTFDILEIHCIFGTEEHIYQANTSDLPKDKKSLHFKAYKDGNSFNIEWSANADSFLKRVK